jgi:hypothetical protein
MADENTQQLINIFEYVFEYDTFIFEYVFEYRVSAIKIWILRASYSNIYSNLEDPYSNMYSNIMILESGGAKEKHHFRICIRIWQAIFEYTVSGK